MTLQDAITEFCNNHYNMTVEEIIYGRKFVIPRKLATNTNIEYLDIFKKKVCIGDIISHTESLHKITLSLVIGFTNRQIRVLNFGRAYTPYSEADPADRWQLRNYSGLAHQCMIVKGNNNCIIQ